MSYTHLTQEQRYQIYALHKAQFNQTQIATEIGVHKATVLREVCRGRGERGINENTNGLVRQYFPKKSAFSKITDRQIGKVEDRLNQRPRKTLGYKTPHEVFFKLPLYCTYDLNPRQLMSN